MADAARSTPQVTIAPTRRVWTLPVLRELPKLTDLTLASSIGGGGGTGGGGSTVFGLLIAAGLLVLSACSASENTTPTLAKLPAAVTAVSCTVNVAAKAVLCGGPFNSAPPDEIIGGQGSRVILRSSNVHYVGTDFTFDVTVQNVGAQTLGTDGLTPTGVRVFFENDPVATGGSGTITVEDDSVGTFTASNQPYYVYTDSLPAHATSASAPWHFSVPGSVTTFTFQVLVSSQVPAHAGILRWQPVATLSKFRYTDVAWSGGNDAMAVGDAGHSKHWNGSTWTDINPVTDEDFTTVTAAAPGVYLAAGTTGKIFRFSGNLWTEVYSSPFGTQLNNVWARDTSNWYAVGVDATVITYHAGAITEDRSPGGQDLMMVSGTADDSVTGVGAQGGYFLLSDHGGPFLGAPSPVGTDFLLGFAWDADGTFFTSSLNGSTFNGYLIRHGATVDTFATGSAVAVTEILPFAHDSLIASAVSLFTSVAQVTKYRYGAVPLSSVAVTPTFLAAGNGGGVVKLDNAGTKFAGIGKNLDLEVTTGGPWSEVEDSTLGPFNASWGRGDSVWVATGSGALFKIVDGVSTPLTGVTGALGIWGFAGNDLYIIAGDAVYSGDGVGPWTAVATLPGGTVKQIWGDQATGTLIVTGFNSRYLQRVGGTWTEPPFSSGGLEGIWGCDIAHVWIAGGSGQIQTWNPGGLAVDPTYPGGATVRFLSGTGCSDVWAGGPNSTLYHYDGVTWSAVPIAGNQIFISALASQSDGVVYVSGEQSKMAAVNTAGITSRMLSSDQLDDILTLWRLDDGDLFVGGKKHAILGRR